MNKLVLKNNLSFVIKTSLLYCILAAAFSFTGIFLPEKVSLGNPLPGFTLHELAGHFAWGIMFGLVTLSIRYCLIAGTFAVLIDSDHLIGLFHIDALGRMSHSVSFGIIAVIVLMITFGRKDYRLGAIAFGAVLSHISFDIFAGDPSFPFLAPFYSKHISFPNISWLYFEIAAIVIVGIAIIFYKKNAVEKTI